MDSIHKKNILITGSTGYLAGRIFQRLAPLNKYHFILGSRDISTASRLSCYQGQELRTFDISSSETFSSALKNIDVIIHLASMNFQDSHENPSLAQKVNVDMVQKLTDEAIKNNVSQFIYMSTFHVYGPDAQGLITEETAVAPKSIYAKTHWEAENIILANKKLEGIVLRLSNAIGAPLLKDISAWKLLVNDLCSQAVNTKKMVLLSTGEQKRDFISISSIGDAIDILISAEKINNNIAAIYNLGSGSTISILDIAKLIQDICAKTLGFTPELERKVDSTVNANSFPDFTYSNKKLQSLGFEVLVSLEEEIKHSLLALN